MQTTLPVFQLLQEIHQLTNQISDLSEDGLYDVATVQSKQAALDKLIFNTQVNNLADLTLYNVSFEIIWKIGGK